MISGGKIRVDSAGRQRRFWPQKSSSILGRHVDYFLSKLLGYSYIPDNKGKVDRNSKGGCREWAYIRSRRVVWESRLLSTLNKLSMGGGVNHRVCPLVDAVDVMVYSNLQAEQIRRNCLEDRKKHSFAAQGGAVNLPLGGHGAGRQRVFPRRDERHDFPPRNGREAMVPSAQEKIRDRYRKWRSARLANDLTHSGEVLL